MNIPRPPHNSDYDEKNRSGKADSFVKAEFSSYVKKRTPTHTTSDITAAQEDNISRPWYMSLFKFLDYPHPSERTTLASYVKYSDYLYLPEIQSAKKHWYAENVSLFFCLVAIAAGVLWGLSRLTGLSELVIVSGIIAVFYFAMMLFKLRVVWASLSYPFADVTREEVRALKNEELPRYTILIPLYQEEKVIPQILKAMTAIDYPPEKLDIIITLEEYDHATREAIIKAGPPRHFKMLILPDVHPKTKPKALNVAFPHTSGEFLVIYDAEIVPDPDQLKKAYIAFRKNPDIACFQTRLDHYNSTQNPLTTLFNAEFSFYYDFFLPGLQKLGFPIPLSGHSTHFRREVLDAIGAWDPYNVTEDCDVGIRLYRRGYHTGVLNSASQEEATSSMRSWVLQRTRWMKGFIQTAMVHLRHPTRFKNELHGWRNLFAFLLTVPGAVLINVLNLVYWALLIIWISFHPLFVKGLFPGPILFVSVVSFIFGNLTFTYLNLVSAYKRERYSLVKYSILSPLYWILLAFASTRSVIQLMTNPHAWEKTTHGFHLDT